MSILPSNAVESLNGGDEELAYTRQLCLRREWVRRLLLLACFFACSVASAANASQPDPLKLQWLGTSSWIVSHGADVVVVDPFFSRPPLRSVVFSSIFPALTGDFVYNSRRIAAVLPELPTNTRAVLLGHAHYDHLMDVPYYLEQPSGQVSRYIGNETAKNILLGFKPPVLHFDVVGTEDRPIPIGNLRIKAIRSDHAPHLFGYTFADGIQRWPMKSKPTKANDYVLGDYTTVYFIDFLNAQGQVAWRVFVSGSASSPDAAEELSKALSSMDPRPTDIAILCVPGWDKVADYPESVLRIVRPKAVLVSHYDNFFKRYRKGTGPQNAAWFADYPGFLQRLRALRDLPDYGFEIYEPKTGDCFRFPGPTLSLKCWVN